MDQLLTEKFKIETELDVSDASLKDLDEKIQEHIDAMTLIQKQRFDLRERIKYLEAENQIFDFLLDKYTRNKIKELIVKLDSEQPEFNRPKSASPTPPPVSPSSPPLPIIGFEPHKCPCLQCEPDEDPQLWFDSD